jgi:hypothetical protein
LIRRSALALWPPQFFVFHFAEFSAKKEAFKKNTDAFGVGIDDLMKE